MTMVPTLGGEELLEGVDFDEPNARGRAGAAAAGSCEAGETFDGEV
jgi:hypothetical protein